GVVEVSEDAEIDVVLERPLRIIVRDQNDNPVSGANVHLVERIYFVDEEGNQKVAMVLRQVVADSEGVVAELISAKSVEAIISASVEGVGEAMEVVNVDNERVHEIVLRLAAQPPAAESSNGSEVSGSSGSESSNESEESAA
ncbi:MAG: hypothetical protein N3F67_06420, partial [Acidilobaceae archaeon]|nr:hypothetical protein [Acidilobaceae archaeon]